MSVIQTKNEKKKKTSTFQECLVRVHECPTRVQYGHMSKMDTGAGEVSVLPRRSPKL